jgi:NAD(P) transhydrogenase subunit alpha
MRIGVPRESAPNENRVALVPDGVEKLVKSGAEVRVQTGAGSAAYYTDDEYRGAGAALVADAAQAFDADLVLKVNRPLSDSAGGPHEAGLLRAGAALVCFLQPGLDADLIERLMARNATVFSMDLVPRISRAQKMDALSSMSTLAGYKAVLLAASALPRFFPLLMTAAGTIAPARVLVLGAGVAGLQAIATARRLGAVVQGFDVRPQVREEVQSLGATFVAMEGASLEGQGGYAKEAPEEFLRRERETLREPVRQADVVIATAMVPGRRAPVLLTADMVQAMKPGSVVVDLAAEQGGNCEWTEAGRERVERGVRVIGAVNLASTIPYHASRMYSRNLMALLGLLVKDGKLTFDWGDEIVAKSCVMHEGRPGAPQPAAAGGAGKATP